MDRHPGQLGQGLRAHGAGDAEPDRPGAQPVPDAPHHRQVMVPRVLDQVGQGLLVDVLLGGVVRDERAGFGDGAGAAVVRVRARQRGAHPVDDLAVPLGPEHPLEAGVQALVQGQALEPGEVGVVGGHAAGDQPDVALGRAFAGVGDGVLAARAQPGRDAGGVRDDVQPVGVGDLLAEQAADLGPRLVDGQGLR